MYLSLPTTRSSVLVDSFRNSCYNIAYKQPQIKRIYDMKKSILLLSMLPFMASANWDVNVEYDKFSNERTVTLESSTGPKSLVSISCNDNITGYSLYEDGPGNFKRVGIRPASLTNSLSVVMYSEANNSTISPMAHWFTSTNSTLASGKRAKGIIEHLHNIDIESNSVPFEIRTRHYWGTDITTTFVVDPNGFKEAYVKFQGVCQ